MDLRIYTPEGHRVSLVAAWGGSWSALLENYAGYLRTTAREEGWACDLRTYVPVKVRNRTRRVSVRCARLKCPECGAESLDAFEHQEREGIPVLLHGPFCSLKCKQRIR